MIYSFDTMQELVTNCSERLRSTYQLIVPNSPERFRTIRHTKKLRNGSERFRTIWNYLFFLVLFGDYGLRTVPSGSGLCLISKSTERLPTAPIYWLQYAEVISSCFLCFFTVKLSYFYFRISNHISYFR